MIFVYVYEMIIDESSECKEPLESKNHCIKKILITVIDSLFIVTWLNPMSNVLQI